MDPRAAVGHGLVLALALAALVVSLPTNAEALQVFDQNLVNEANPPFWTEVYQNQKVAQSFNASADYYLSSIALRVQDAKRPDLLRIDLRPSLLGLPDDNVTLATANASAPVIDEWYWLTFTLNTTIRLNRGQAYWIVASNTRSIRNGYLWGSSNLNALSTGLVAYKVSADPWVTFDGDDQIFRTFGTPHSASLDLDVWANRTVAEPGDNLHVSVNYNNSGINAANQVWINLTLPPGVSFALSTPSPTFLTATAARWAFTSVATGNHSLEVNLTLATDLVDGGVVPHTATLEYTNETGVHQGLTIDTAATVIRAPRILASLTVDVGNVTPGDLVTYNILYFNTGSRPAARLTIEDNLPQGLTYVDNSAEANRTVGTNWTFYSVQPGSYGLTLRAGVAPQVGAGVLVNRAILRSFNARGQMLQNITGTVAVTAGAAQPPAMSLTVSADHPRRSPGAVVTLALTYVNAGPGRASEAWVNLTLPPEVVLVGATPRATLEEPRRMAWRLVDLDVGNGTIQVQLRIMDDTRTSRLVPTATLTFADVTGRWVGSTSAFTVLEVDLPPVTNPEYLLGGALLGLAIVAGFILIRRGALNWLLRRRALFEEIFLLHRSGLLIRHYSRSIRPDLDTDVVGGMLVAVQEFVKDSFRGAGLRELKVGKTTIMVVQGRLTTLAASVSGPKTGRISHQLVAAVDEIEARFGHILANWTGITEELAGADEVLTKLLTGRFGRRRVRAHPHPPPPPAAGV